MAYIPLKLPPGVYRNGTQYQSAGRWYDANLVRWSEGTLRPIGGWAKRQYFSSGYQDIQLAGAPRGSHAWRANNQKTWLAAGSFKKLYAMEPSYDAYDITPIRESGTLTNTFSTTAGLKTVGVADNAHGLTDGDTVIFSSGTAIGASGITLAGAYVVTTTSNNAYTVQASANAATTESGAGSASYQYEIPTGRSDSIGDVGYGKWAYGFGAYGVARPQLSSTGILAASTWALDNWGEYLVACRSDSGEIYEWQLGSTTRAALLANAPINNNGILVTPERFLFALGAGGNPRKVQWCDQEANTVWSPAATNQAGDFELSTTGEIVCGERTRYGSLILTTTDAHLATYQGPPFVYGFERVGMNCGVISAQASAALDNGAAWMSNGGFFFFDGAVRPLACEVSDYVFSDFNYNQQAKVAAVVNADFFEVWWFYPSSGSTENDRYVLWNYRENTWNIGSLARTTGVPVGAFSSPIFFDPAGFVYDHETGFNYGGAMPFAETGPIEIGRGDQIVVARQVVPDERLQGQVRMRFKSRFAPEGAETTHGPYTISSQYTDVRFSGRQVSFRVEGVQLSDWRVGDFRLEAVAGGRR